MGAGLIIGIIFLIFFGMLGIAAGVIGYMYFFLQPGDACKWNIQCLSGECEGNLDGLKIGKCKGSGDGTGADGSSCSDNSDCKNGVCANSHAGKSVYICCPSGKKVLYAGYNYCTGMTAGTACWSDAMCASKKCKNNMGGLKKGTCE